LLADRGYDVNKLIELAKSTGIEVVIPPKRNLKGVFAGWADASAKSGSEENENQHAISHFQPGKTALHAIQRQYEWE